MAFEYIASTEDGKIKKGKSDLATRDSVIKKLERQGLIVISVDKITKIKGLMRINAILIGTIGNVEIVLFTKHLSIMLRAGLTLLESLDILKEQATTWRMRTVLATLKNHVERGGKLSDAFATYPQVFSPFYINIIRAGEVSGTLDKNLEHLAVQFTKDFELRRKVKLALMYPTVVIVMGLLIGFFFATFVLPQIASLFTGLGGVELPLSTRILLKVSEIAREHTMLAFFGLVGSIIFFMWFIRRKFLAPVTHLIALRLPIFGRIVQNVNLARFSLVFSTMLSSGVDIIKALEVTSNVLNNIYYKRILQKTLIEVQRGHSVSEILMTSKDLFPPITSRMIGIGEQAGKLEEVLLYLSDFYELEVEATMRNLSTILEPIMLLIIGGMALFMAYAILIPIYNFISVINTI